MGEVPGSATTPAPLPGNESLADSVRVYKWMGVEDC